MQAFESPKLRQHTIPFNERALTKVFTIQPDEVKGVEVGVTAAVHDILEQCAAIVSEAENLAVEDGVPVVKCYIVVAAIHRHLGSLGA